MVPAFCSIEFCRQYRIVWLEFIEKSIINDKYRVLDKVQRGSYNRMKATVIIIDVVSE